MNTVPPSVARVTPATVTSKEQLKALPRQSWQGRTHIITSPAQAAKAVDRLMRENDGPHHDRAHVVGLDLEHKPTFRAGEIGVPALIQVRFGMLCG